MLLKIFAVAITVFLALSRLGASTTDDCPASFDFVEARSSDRVDTPISKTGLSLQADSRSAEILSLTHFGGRGLIILLFDASGFLPGTTVGGQIPNANTEPLVRAASHVLRQLPADAPVTIYTYYYGLHVIRDFSLKASGALALPPLTPEMIQDASRIFERRMIPPTSMSVFHTERAEIVRWEMLESIADHVADVPGRKVLVWFGGNHITYKVPPPEGPLYQPWFAATSAVQRVHLSIYPVADFSYRKLMKDMSTITGGRFYETYGRLGQAIHDALQDSRQAYQLCWNKTRISSTQTHTVRLQSYRPTGDLLYPHLFVEPILPRREDLRLKAAEAALVTPLTARSIQMYATMEKQFSEAASVSIQFDGRGIELENVERKFGGLLDVLFAYYDAEGNRLPAGQHDTIRLGVKPEHRHEFLTSRHAVRQNLRPPRSATMLRIVIRDANSGAMGSASLPLQ